MSKATHVPKFGNWDQNDQMPFTAVFEKVRADHKGGTGAGKRLINPNDPSENPAAFGIKSNEGPPSGITSKEGPPFSRNPPPQQHADESSRRVKSAGVEPNVSGSPLRATIVEHSKKGSHGGEHDNDGVNLGEARSTEQSPSHPSSPFRGRLGNRPSAPPPSSLGPDKRGTHEGGTPSHPSARNRLHRGSRGEDMFSAERASALPKFGAWDEKDPSSGDGFTVIFSHARNEKIKGAASIPSYQSDPIIKVDHDDAYKPQHQSVHRKATSWACCCFQA